MSHPGSRWSNYWLVTGALVVATAARAALTPVWGSDYPFVSYYPAVMFAAYVAGWRAGIVATLLSATLITLFFLPRPIGGPAMGVLAFFVAANAIILLLAQRMTRGRARAEAAAAEACSREEQLRTSEQEFRALFETASVGHAQADVATGRFLRVNQTLCDLTGYTADELLRMTFYDLTYPDDRDENRRGFERFVAEGRPAYTLEKRYVRKDGGTVWVKVEASLIRDAHRRPTHTGAVIEDVTAAREATAALARSREELRAVLDAAPVAIWIAHDPDCQEVTQNEFADALLGSDAHALPCVEPLRHAAIANESIQDVEFDVVRADGHRVWLFGGAVPLRDPDGTVRGSVAACIDISARKEADEALRHQLEVTRTITANTPSMLFMMDREGRCTFANEAAVQTVGYTADELLGEVLHQKIHHSHPDGRPYPSGECPLDRALPHRTVVSGHEDVFVRKNGTFFPVRCAARPIFRGDEPVGTVIEAQDITQERRAADALRAREHELRLALKSGRMASVVWDIPAERATWSEEYYGLLGLPAGSITPSYEAWRTRVHSDDLPRVETAVQRAMNAHQDLVVEYRNVWADGTIKWVEGRGHFDYDADGRPLRMTGMLMDVDHRKAAEEARERAAVATQRIQRIADAMLADLGLDALLHEVLSRVSSALETDTATILILELNDHDGEVSLVASVGTEQEFREHLGVPIGQGFAGLVAAERRPVVWNEVDPARLLSPVLRRKGVRSLAGVPLLSGDHLLGVLHVGSVRPRTFSQDDVTLLQLAAERIALGLERTARREAERRARDIAEQANRAKDEFLAMLGHELRNPLAAIRNAVAMTELDPGRRERALGIVLRQSQHLGRLVEDLLDVARVAQGKITLRLDDVDLRAVAERAVEATRTLIDDRRHVLSLSLAPDVCVRGDAERLEQVIGNLLTNAAKYTEPGGRIELSVARDVHDAVVSVCDTGVGIAPEMLPSVFDMFVQSDQTLDRSRGGLGVGLTVVRRLVELHGGRIEARSDGIGKGSEFVVRLPARAPHERPTPAPSAPPVPTPGAHVLLVEDNVDAADALASLLQVMGQDVQVVHDGPSAVAAARVRMPDLALIDIGLPGMTGYDVAGEIRALPHGRDALLVALTGYGKREDQERALAAGFDEHRTKPVELDALQMIVERLRRHAGSSDCPTLH